MKTHIPVLLTEAIEALHIKKNAWYIDATFGRGGHTTEILNKGGKVIAFDQDAEAIEYGFKQFREARSENRLILIHKNFSTLAEEIKMLQSQNLIEEIAGILFDFGTSTEQLKSSERGFSFEGDGPLDMRMDTRLGVQAKDLLIALPEKQLEQLFREYGGEESSKGVAKAIKRSKQPVETVAQLRSIVMTVKRGQWGKLHPATKVFQALRIAVNFELDSIAEALKSVLSVLKKDAYIVTIAFHEGEDRIVKNTIKNWYSQGLISEPQRIKPSEAEIAANPRSRSAVLRIAHVL